MAKKECTMVSQLEVSITEGIKNALSNLGRTEDVKLSPDEHRLAIAGYRKNKILLVDLNIEFDGNDKKVSLTGHTEISSPNMDEPHGLTFINNEALIVANRLGDVHILELPPKDADITEIEIHPFVILSSDSPYIISSPGSVSVSEIELELYELLVCNNYSNHVSRHILDGKNNYRVISSTVLLRNELDIPDGVATNINNKWIAISNHNTRSVLLFENTPKLNSLSSHDGLLVKVNYPHGVRFTPDDNFVLVADAGSPYVHIYSKDGCSWAGEREPVASIRILDDKTFEDGRYNPQEGGPKGIDLDSSMRILVTTNEKQTLAFYDVEEVLEKLRTDAFISSEIKVDKNILEQRDEEYFRSFLIRELEKENNLRDLQNAYVIADHKQQINNIYQTRSVKLTAPLRWLNKKTKYRF